MVFFTLFIGFQKRFKILSGGEDIMMGYGGGYSGMMNYGFGVLGTILWIESLKATSMLNVGSLFLGLVTLSGLTWVTTYATIALYNRWAK